MFAAALVPFRCGFTHAILEGIPTSATRKQSLIDQPAIAAKNLTKHYGDVRAVDGINLSVQRGEIYGFLGRNGAGKTTAIRMMLGLIRPTSGEVEVLGTAIEPGTRSVFGKVGYLVESATAYPNLTVRENLDIQRRLTKTDESAVGRVIQQLGLSRYADRPAAGLSQGNRQRLALARALIHDPELLILDEPVNGLDPAGIVEVRKLLLRLADEQGVTIFLSSHILSEIAQIADRIGVIHDGKILEELTRQQWRERSRRYLKVRLMESGQAEEATRLLEQNGFDVSEVIQEDEALEDYFLRLTGGE